VREGEIHELHSRDGGGAKHATGSYAQDARAQAACKQAEAMLLLFIQPILHYRRGLFNLCQETLG